jgi:glycosyltransferase involved in cell wall biosynthesis
MPSTSLRILGISIPDVSDWREPVPEGKWSQFFGALAKRYELVGVIHPELSGMDRYLNRARTFHPRKSTWSARAGFSRSIAERRTEAVQRGLQSYAGSYDLIMQLQTLCAPGSDRNGIPYTIYTDSTMALTRRLYPGPRRPSEGLAAPWIRFEAEVCKSANIVFTYSEFARRSVIEDYDCSPDAVVAVGAGANQMLESLGEKDYSGHRALFVGMDFMLKGGGVLLEAWPLVRQCVPDAELTLAGPKRKPAGRLPPGVSWVGRLNRVDLGQLYRSSTVFVLPSLFDAWGHVFLEAMGYGLPCIGTSCCAMSEIIEEGVTGRLVPRYEPEPLAAALIELLADPTKAATMGRAGYRKVAQGYRWSDVLDRVAGHLDASFGEGEHTRSV